MQSYLYIAKIRSADQVLVLLLEKFSDLKG